MVRLTRRRARYVAAMALLPLLGTLLGCGQLGLGRKYFLTACAGNGPEQNTDFELSLPPFDLDRYYAELESLRVSFQFEEIERISYEDHSYPIYWIRRPGPGAAPRLLVVAGVHGDERAALLAIPRVLRRLARATGGTDSWDVSVVVPANPVGAAHTSRYNGSGCDVNRDFRTFSTREASAVRRIVDQYSPNLVVATHEGPQDGFFLIATSAADPKLAREIVDAVEGAGVSLARRSFMGLALGTPGLSVEGVWTTLGKRLIRLGSLGTFLESLDVGTYTTESSWNSDDFEERINSHVVAIEAILNGTLPGYSARGESFDVRTD